MGWGSVFDAGACTVVVDGGSDTQELYRQVMAKNSSGSFVDPVSEATIDVIVDGAGHVTLERTSGWTQFDPGFALRVIPGFDPGSRGIRVSSIEAGSPSGYALQALALCDYSDMLHNGVPLQLIDEAWQPDPADFSALPSHKELTVYVVPGAG